MVKKKRHDCLLCQNLKPPCRTSILLKIGENCERLGNIWQVFSNVGRTYFTLSVDRFLTSTTNKKNQMRPGLKTSVFFCFCFFFYVSFCCFFFLRFASKVEKKYHLVRIVPHRNCTDTCFSKMFYQHYSRSHNIASSNTSGILIRHWSKHIT